MRFYLMESAYLSRLRSDRRDLLSYARELKTAEAMREARAELLSSAQIHVTPKSEDEAKKSYSVVDGVAQIPVVGELTPIAATDICGAYTADALTEYGFIQAAVLAADADPGVLEIALMVNSPGGYVDGVDETGQIIAAAKKPTSARVSGMAASAAYWLASQTDRIIALSPSTRVGSIGVALEEYDDNQMLADMGIEHRVYTSTDAPDKRPDTSKPEGQAKIVAQLDKLHGVFARRVSEGRGVSVASVNKDFGRGDLVIADDALAVGMIDEIHNTQKVRTGVAGGKPAAKAAVMEGDMDLKVLQKEHPEVFAEAVKLGVSQERKRVEDLRAWLEVDPACTPVVNEAIAQGKSLDQVQNQINIAIAKASRSGNLEGDNAPAVSTGRAATGSGEGEDDPEKVVAQVLAMIPKG